MQLFVTTLSIFYKQSGERARKNSDFDERLQNSYEPKREVKSLNVIQPSFAKLSEALSKYVNIYDLVAKFDLDIWYQTNEDFVSLLHVATMYGHLNAIEFLLYLDMDINRIDKHGRTPLHYVGVSCYNIVKVTDFLLHKGANIFAVDDDKNTMAHVIPWSKFVFKELYHSWVNYVVKQGHGNVFEKKNNEHKTPLHTAIEMFDVGKETMRLIFKNSATSINDKNMYGNTVLLLGSNNGRSWKNLEQIVKLGGDPNETNLDGNGVLHYALRTSNLNAMKYFISIGVDIDRRNCYDKTAIQMLQDARQNIIEITLLLIQEGADIYHLNDKNDSIAHIVSLNKHITANDYLKWVQAMLKIGHQQLFRVKGAYGNTPLHLAVQRKNVCESALKLLLKVCKNDINVKNNDGCTALQKACQFGKNAEFLKILVRHNADWALTDLKGNNVIYYCFNGCNNEGLSYFKSLGADMSSLNNIN